MRKALFILLIIPFMFLESCRNDFNINAPYKDVYTLNCILRNDDSLQYAIISKNVYTENGTAPDTNIINQNIRGANIKISYHDSVFVMRDTTIELTDSGSVSRVNCYYTKNLVMQPSEVISIEAVIPGGTILKSTIQVPNISRYYYTRSFPQYRAGYVTLSEYTWSWSISNILSFPEIEIYYKKYEGGIYVDKKMLVPLSFYPFTDDNGEILMPADLFSLNNLCYTTLKTINKTMHEISGNDPDKNNYIITKVLLNIIALDQDLSRYYSAYNVHAESFTIKLRPTDYSNIEGGEGVFGAYYKFVQPLAVDSLYVRSFGYQYEPK
jgi:hypothetical protein